MLSSVHTFSPSNSTNRSRSPWKRMSSLTRFKPCLIFLQHSSFNLMIRPFHKRTFFKYFNNRISHFLMLIFVLRIRRIVNIRIRVAFLMLLFNRLDNLSHSSDSRLRFLLFAEPLHFV